jgi:hypothetical protein
MPCVIDDGPIGRVCFPRERLERGNPAFTVEIMDDGNILDSRAPQRRADQLGVAVLGFVLTRMDLPLAFVAATAAALAVQTVTLRFVHGDARARGYLGQISRSDDARADHDCSIGLHPYRI